MELSMNKLALSRYELIKIGAREGQRYEYVSESSLPIKMLAQH